MVKYLLILVSYLVGSIPFGFIFGKIKGIDIREHGSNNIGTTNVGRVLGYKLAFVTYFFDCLKGFIFVFLFRFNIIDSSFCFLSPMVYGFAAILGHTFPIYLNFKGGKAVATSAGVILGYCPWLVLIGTAVFFIVVYISEYVSLGSLCASSVVAIISIALTIYKFDPILKKEIDIYYGIICLITLIVIFLRHKKNIIRLKNKEESKVNWRKKQE